MAEADLPSERSNSPPLDDRAAPIALTATPLTVESPDIGESALGPHALNADPLSVGAPELGTPALGVIPSTDWMHDVADQAIQNIEVDRRRRSVAATAQQPPSAPPLPLQASAAMSGSSGIEADATLVPGPATLHQEVLRRLASVEEAVAALTLIHTELRAGIGHNQPPEPIESLPIDSGDRRTIEVAAAILRALQVAPPAPPAIEAGQAVNELARIGRKATDYAAKQGDNFISEVVKGAAQGIMAATIAGGSAYYLALYILGERLNELAEVAHALIEMLSLPH